MGLDPLHLEVLEGLDPLHLEVPEGLDPLHLEVPEGPGKAASRDLISLLSVIDLDRPPWILFLQF